MSSLMRYDPFEELNNIQRHFFGDDLMMNDAAASIPTTDVYEKGNDLYVEAHLPDFDKKDVSIDINGDNLTISAKRHEKDEDKDKRYIVRESASSFFRSISLPERANKDEISADMVNGKLVVKIPMAPLPTTRRVEIGDGHKADEDSKE